MNKLHSYLQTLQTTDPFFNISFILMSLMMVLLPFTTYFMWPIGILLMLLWLAQGNWREKWENFKVNDGIPYGFFLLGICLIPILGFINSENIPIAWRTFECYIWFFFTPLIFLTASPKTWKRQHFDVLLSLFTIGEAIYLANLFIFGIYRMVKTGDSSYMYNNFFCYNSHHAYTALYITFAYLLIFEWLINHQHEMPTRRIIGLYLLELFFAVGVFCVYSRAGILTFLFMHTLWCGYAVYRKRSRWKYMIALFLFIAGLFTTLVLTSPSNRFTEASIFFRHKHDDHKETDSRWIIWQAAWDGAVENLPWGVGTGDGNDVVVEKYHENGHWLKRNHPYNAHNQLLFSLLTNGILGLILTILYFITPLCTGIKHRDFMLISIFILLFSNCMFECMFDRRAGVDFFAIMIPLFMLKAHALKENPIQ